MKNSLLLCYLLFCIVPWSPAQQGPGSAEAVLHQLKSLAEKETADDVLAVVGEDGWLFLDQELRHLGAGQFWGDAAAEVSQASSADMADPLPAILDFHRQLNEAGIELILAPIPPKAVIYPDKLPAAVEAAPRKVPDERLDPFHQTFYNTLRESGVHVLDMTGAFLEARQDANAAPVYARTDTHYSGHGVVLLAEAIAAKLAELGIEKGHANLQVQTRDEQISGDLLQSLPDDAEVEPETMKLTYIKDAEGNLVTRDETSPVLLLGDSHTLVYHAGADLLARGAGLPDHLAHELGFPVDLIGVRGSGATPARIDLFRKAKANPDWLKNKKAIIWVFAAREFTESSGWRIVPIGL